MEGKTVEYLDICDEHGLPTGERVERSAAHRDGIRHRTAHVWIVRRQKGRWQVLLQKRSMNKDSFPGLYDTSSAGHIPAGSEPLPSALRELEEELGIRAGEEDLRYAGQFTIRYEKVFHQSMFRDHEVASVYVYMKPVDASALVLQAEEVERADWFDLDELVHTIKNRRDVFCVPSETLNVLTSFLEKTAGWPEEGELP